MQDANNENEFIEDGEFSEDAPLSAEELFELHKAEIDERFEEKGFFRRLREMFSGLSKPKSSREYKLARTELQRLIAPLCAILLPVLGVGILIVVTAVAGNSKDALQIEVQRAQDKQEDLEEPEEPEPEEQEKPPEEQVEVMVDTPTVGPVTDVVAPQPVNEPVSVKPATQDSVSLIKSPVTMKAMTGSRSPGSIGAMTKGGAQYGDANTEAAVLKALRWLKYTQKSDGSWSPSPTANTALAVLAFLAHGETPESKEFGTTVEKAMQFLINQHYVDKNGVSRFKGSDGHEYAYLIATYALCEAYGMTKNPNTKTVAMQTLQRIVDNQSPTGGWDYKMAKDSVRDDLSYAGWAMQALKAGKMAGMQPKGLDACIKKAISCLKKRNFKGGGFNYTAGGGPTGLTATGCLAMQLLGHGNAKEVSSALDFMREWKPAFKSNGPNGKPFGAKSGGPLPGHNPQYYCYYAAQCKYQAGMCSGATPANEKSWQEWNLAMKQVYPGKLITLPETIPGPDGKPRKMGYWKMIAEETCKGGGDTMATSLCALQLMVYYRYLPTTSLKAGKADGDAEKENEKEKKSKEVEVEVDI